MTPDDKPDDVSPNKNTRDMEAAIGETRAAFSNDIKALTDKASAANVKHEIKQAVKIGKDAVVEQAVDTVAEVKNVIVDKAIEVKDAAVDQAIDIKDATVETAQHAVQAATATFEGVGMQARHAGKAAWTYTVKNAMPLALIGVGAGWLLSSQRRNSARRALPAGRWEREPEYDEAYLANDAGLASNAAYPAGGRSRSTANGLDRTDTMNDGSPYAGRRVRQSQNGERSWSEPRAAGAGILGGTRNLYDQAGASLGGARRVLADGASRGRERVKGQFGRARKVSADFVDRNPLAMALGALVAGVGIGLMLPSTSREDELLASSRDRMKRSFGSAREALDGAGRVAKQAARETLAKVEGGAY